MGTVSDKSVIRAQLLGRRSALDTAARAEASERVIAHLLAHIPPNPPPSTGADQPPNPPPTAGADQPPSTGADQPPNPPPTAGADQPPSAGADQPPNPPPTAGADQPPSAGADQPPAPGPAPASAGQPVVAAYVPIGAEPGGPHLPDALRDAGARVLLPVLRPDNDLDWAEYEGGLDPARRGLLEPPGPRLGVDAITGAALVIVPALAVDRRGARLGRGGGSYDRALARVPAGVPVLALLHDGELVDEVPTEPHDRLVSAVITPSGGWCDLPYIR